MKGKVKMKLVLFGCSMTYAILPTGSRHDDGIAIAEQMESVMEKMMSDGGELGVLLRIIPGNADEHDEF
ncbi:hypothetical protein PC116_g3046 [Phytophthora cactorum]|nr:hypothetical protein PC120_g710 [Phytophthora cactorum]KAG4249260.1 hypothetical protein PC116_g3046 [Phytophthora cactorum]